jgi:hypothetical protein
MNIDTLTSVLGWITLLNIGLLLVWWLLLLFAKEWIFNMHRHWFSLTNSQFNEIHYQLYGQYKLATLLLFITPYLSLKIVA